MPWKTSEKNGKVVFIDVDLDEIKRRVTNIKTRGIAFGKGETLDDVYRVRYPLYKKYADITVSMELSSIETTVDAIVEKLKLENRIKKSKSVRYSGAFVVKYEIFYEYKYAGDSLNAVFGKSWC